MSEDNSSTRPTDINLLHSLSSSFHAVLDLPELLRRIVDASMQLTSANGGQAALMDPDTAQLSVFTMDGEHSGLTEWLGDALPDMLISHVITRENPLAITPGDDLKRFGVSHSPQHPKLYVPLRLQTRPLGVLILTRGKKQPPFSAADQDMIVALAGYAAIAIENALLYKQALDRSLELNLLVESANSISSSLELGQVLNAIARHLMRALQTHWCIISSWTRETGCIRRLAEYRSAYWPDDQAPRLSLQSHPIHAKAVQTGKPHMSYLHEKVQSDPEQTSLHHLGFSRMLALPLMADSKVVGLVQLANIHKTERFTPVEIGQSLRATLEIGPVIRQSGTENRQALLGEMARSLCSIAGTNWCTFYAVDARAGVLQPILTYGTGIWYESASPEIDVADFPTLGVVLREQRIAVLRSTDTNLPPAEQPFFEPVGPSAMLVLPLVFRARTVGIVQLFDLHPARVFSGRELGLARALANQASIALENAHLVHDLQRSFEELQSMQGQLVRTARLTALGELSAVVAHQINNPLTTILGDAEMLVQDLPADAPAHDNAEAILRAGHRAKSVVERILRMARGDDDARAMNVNDTIEEMLQLVGLQIRQYSIDLAVDLAEDLPPALISPGPLGDVWLNLLINARDAIVQNRASQGRIELASRLLADQDIIEVTVADNGGGIPPEHLERVFNPFYTTKPHGKGTGLGLYICHQIVTEHNAVISLDSKPGQGTVVSVRLPVLKSEAEGKVWLTS
jgi:signal transduction histidine kinase